eukprot:jgi/Chrpa1/13047/Chrysochromulina_OHIO_Genome00017260-RA
MQGAAAGLFDPRESRGSPGAKPPMVATATVAAAPRAYSAELERLRARMPPTVPPPSAPPPGPAIPPIPNFARVRSSDSDLAAASAAAPKPPSPVPKIPNFGRALSGLSSSSSSSVSGSLSARSPDKPGAADELEARRPLTARGLVPRSELGLTPRSAAMLGPRPGDRSMRGMEALLIVPETAMATPRGENHLLTPRGDLTPRSPRGTGSRAASMTSAVTSAAGTCAAGGGASVAGAAPQRAAEGRRPNGLEDWLRPAFDAARSEAGGKGGAHGWLRAAVGASVRVVVGELSVEHAAATDEPVVVHADALRRVVPRRGERARVVLGESRALEGEVLSVEGGVAVLKIAPSAAEVLGQVGGGDPRRVRVLPLDALCRVE